MGKCGIAVRLSFGGISVTKAVASITCRATPFSVVHSTTATWALAAFIFLSSVKSAKLANSWIGAIRCVPTIGNQLGAKGEVSVISGPQGKCVSSD